MVDCRYPTMYGDIWTCAWIAEAAKQPAQVVFNTDD
jgi:hypothetical protein